MFQLRGSRGHKSDRAHDDHESSKFHTSEQNISYGRRGFNQIFNSLKTFPTNSHKTPSFLESVIKVVCLESFPEMHRFPRFAYLRTVDTEKM